MKKMKNGKGGLARRGRRGEEARRGGFFKKEIIKELDWKREGRQ